MSFYVSIKKGLQKEPSTFEVKAGQTYMSLFKEKGIVAYEFMNCARFIFREGHNVTTCEFHSNGTPSPIPLSRLSEDAIPAVYYATTPPNRNYYIQVNTIKTSDGRLKKLVSPPTTAMTTPQLPCNSNVHRNANVGASFNNVNHNGSSNRLRYLML